MPKICTFLCRKSNFTGIGVKWNAKVKQFPQKIVQIRQNKHFSRKKAHFLKTGRKCAAKVKQIAGKNAENRHFCTKASKNPLIRTIFLTYYITKSFYH